MKAEPLPEPSSFSDPKLIVYIEEEVKFQYSYASLPATGAFCSHS
jgi:hypothetical protein